MAKNVLDDLIRIKTKKQDDDLLKLLDEIPVYEKLSADEKLKDLKNSEITRKKCPLLAGFADGNLYEMILGDLAANIYLQIEGQIPGVLMSTLELGTKTQKQMEVLQKGITSVEYRELTEYDHGIMGPYLAGVFTTSYGAAVMAVLIVKEARGYTMYHGVYTPNNADQNNNIDIRPNAYKGTKGIFRMDSYSVLGNNGYPFGHYASEQGSYDVMIGPDKVLYLLNGAITISHELGWEELNKLNVAKKEPDSFAKTVLSIIESVV